MSTLQSNMLVIGSGGLLGSELMRFLSERYTVYGATRADLDITDESSVIRYIEAVNPGLVLHCAAWTDVDACESDPDKATAINVDGAKHVGVGCREVGASMIFFSSDYVFNGLKKEPYLEDDQPAPLSVYGQTKLAAEKAVIELVEQATIIRTGWMYGLAGKSFVRTIIEAARRQQSDKEAGQTVPPLRIVNDQIGSPTWTFDLAGQTQTILEHRLTGIIHAVGNGQTSWYDLAKRICSCMNLSVDIEPCSTDDLGRPAHRPAYSVLENRRLNDAGCDQMRPYQDALQEFINTCGAQIV